MRKKVRNVILNGVLFFGIFFLTFWSIFHDENIGKVSDMVFDADILWLIPAVFCVLIFIWGESIIIWYMLRTCGIRLRQFTCFLFSSIGFFFSCVTPSASGGQPVQIYFMKKKQIPVPIATVILMIVTITYKLVLIVIGIGVRLFGGDLLEVYLGDLIYIFYLGLFLNIVVVTAMILLVFHPSLVRNFLVILVSRLEKMHLLKHKENRLDKINQSMGLYRDTANYMADHIRVIVNIFVITFIQRIALFAVTWLVYKSFHLRGYSWITFLILQSVISVSVDMLPLPGGMGISERLFLSIFEPVFGPLLLPGMILSRGLSYYSELIISAIFSVVTVVVFQLSKKNKDTEISI